MLRKYYFYCILHLAFNADLKLILIRLPAYYFSNATPVVSR